MSEQMATQSWRPQRSTGLTPEMRRMALIAAAVAGVAGVGVLGYVVAGRHSHGVPVIEAPAGPIRVKPDNPGGMQVAGADEQGNGTDGDSADTLAPPPEAPQLSALQAQIQAAHQPPPAPPPAAPAPLQAPALSAPAPAAPAPVTARTAAAAPAVPAAPPPAHPVVAGGTAVQLAALGSEAAARAEWSRLAHQMPELLGSRKPDVLQAQRDGKPIWRVRTGGFADIAAATSFCKQVRAKGGDCSIATF